MRLILPTALVMIAFAANSVLTRLALAGGGIGPVEFGAIRIAAGALALAALARSRGRGLPFAAPGRWIGVLALAVYILGFSLAYRSLDAGLGALILFGWVQITMFAGALLAGEAVPPRRWCGAALAFAGLVWLLWPVGAHAPPPAGAALMAAAGIGWGIYSLRGRKEADPGAATAANFVLATPLVLLALPLGGWPAVTAGGVGLAVICGVVTSGLGYALWYAVLPRLAAATAAVAQLTVPLIAMAGGAALLAEPLTLRFAGAAVLVIGGIALSLRRGGAPARSRPQS